jgi:site-specific DNA-cytosine methylase
MRLLDLFCGAGGCSMGYHRAGFEVVGVDIKPQKHYPFEFHCADAFAFLEQHGHEFDVIHASPPCQAYSSAMKHLAKPKPMLIDGVREALIRSGKRWVIENVPGAPMRNPTILCGTMFGMRIHRHRLFESPSLDGHIPQPCTKAKNVINPHRAASRERIHLEFGKQDPKWACLGWVGMKLDKLYPPPIPSGSGEG